MHGNTPSPRGSSVARQRCTAIPARATPCRPVPPTTSPPLVPVRCSFRHVQGGYRSVFRWKLRPRTPRLAASFSSKTPTHVLCSLFLSSLNLSEPLPPRQAIAYVADSSQRMASPTSSGSSSFALLDLTARISSPSPVRPSAARSLVLTFRRSLPSGVVLAQSRQAQRLHWPDGPY